MTPSRAAAPPLPWPPEKKSRLPATKNSHALSRYTCEHRRILAIATGQLQQAVRFFSTCYMLLTRARNIAGSAVTAFGAETSTILTLACAVCDVS